MSGFGARFSSSQRAALQALGFGVLERAAPGAPWTDLGEQEPEAADTRGDRARGSAAAPTQAMHAPPPTRRTTARPQAAAPVRAGRSAPASGALPSRVVIDGLGEDAPLLRGILAVVHARLGTGDSRVLRTSSALRIDTGGPGPQWRVGADELRASPRRKAALWRALRQLERTPRG